MLLFWIVPILSSPCDSRCKAQLPNASAVAERYLNLAMMSLTGSLTEAGTCNGTVENGVWLGKWSGCDLDILKPANPQERKQGSAWAPFAITMVGTLRLQNIRSAIEAVEASGVGGDYVETGVWRGGASVFAKLVMDTLFPHQRRRLHCFDAFETLLPGAGYGSSARARFLATTLRGVRKNFERYQALDERVHFHRGLFNDTLPAFGIRQRELKKKIAVLRVDGNFFMAHVDIFYHLYGLVPIGGIVILDDAFGDATSFLKFMGDTLPSVERVDVLGGWFRKTRHLNLDAAWYSKALAANTDK